MERRVGLWRLTALTVLTVSLACGGGGGRGGPTTPLPSLTFTPGSASPPAVTLVRTNAADPDLLELAVRANQVLELYGVAFDLAYPAALLRFDGSSEGTHLSGGGAATSFQLAQPETGTLVIGLTRLGDTGSVDGSGDLLLLRFTALASGSGALSLTREQAFDDRGQALTVSWAGGSVAIRR